MMQIFFQIERRLSGADKVAFMGIGEEKLSDDGVGPYVISELLEYANDKFLFINAKIDPMSRIDDIVKFKPSHLVVIDTCTFKGEPGTVRLFEREQMRDYAPISTHTVPITIVIDLIAKQLPHLTVFMIGFVPETLEGFTDLKIYKEPELTLDERSQIPDLPFFELHLSKIVKNSADQLVYFLKKSIL